MTSRFTKSPDTEEKLIEVELDLPQDCWDYIDELVEKGEYPSVDKVIEAALTEMMELKNEHRD